MKATKRPVLCEVSNFRVRCISGHKCLQLAGLTRVSYVKLFCVCFCSMCRGFSLYTHVHVRKDKLALPRIAQICTQISQVRTGFCVSLIRLFENCLGVFTASVHGV